MRRSLLVAWSLAAIALCLRADPWLAPLTGDNQLYFFASERAASGVAPHVSIVDSKNQLGVLIQAAAIRAGRVAGADDVASTRVVSIAAVAVSAVTIAALATSLTGSVLAGHVAALALLATRGLTIHAAVGSSVKIYLIAFVLLAHLAMRKSGTGTYFRETGSDPFSARRSPRIAIPSPLAALATRGSDSVFGWDVTAGLAAGAAFVCWQPALVVVVAVVVEAWLRGGRLRASRVLLAALAMVAAYELYFVGHGALAEQLRQAYAMPLGSLHRPRPLARSLAFLLNEARGDLPRLGPVAFALFATAGMAALIVKPQRAIEALRNRAGAISLAAASLAATAFTIYDHQGLPDLFFVAPYFALACGLLVAAARAWSPRVATATAGLVAIVLCAQILGDEAGRKTKPYNLVAQRELARNMREQAETSGPVWAYGAVHLLALEHLDNHVAMALFWDDVRALLAGDSWRPLRDGRMPALITDSRGLPEPLRGWLEREYEDITTPQYAAQDLRLWRRIEPQAIEAP